MLIEIPLMLSYSLSINLETGQTARSTVSIHLERIKEGGLKTEKIPFLLRFLFTCFVGLFFIIQSQQSKGDVLLRLNNRPAAFSHV